MKINEYMCRNIQTEELISQGTKYSELKHSIPLLILIVLKLLNELKFIRNCVQNLVLKQECSINLPIMISFLLKN